jgi:transcriptional regulator with XRE-family HTH domain
VENLGEQLREARQGRGWTLETLSTRSGLSTGFLSQVERGQSTLSIVSLSAICRALEIPIDRLFTSSAPLGVGAPRVTKAAAQLRIQIGDSAVSYRYLTPQLPAVPVEELLIAELPPNARQEATAHDGEELGFVLEGTLRLLVGGDDCALAAGDSYRVASREQHEYRAGRSGARILMAVTQRFIESAARRGRRMPAGDRTPNAPRKSGTKGATPPWQGLKTIRSYRESGRARSRSRLPEGR